MAKWVRSVVFRLVPLFLSALTITTACSNIFSQIDGGTGDIAFEFRANMLFSETGSVGVPYLIPTADRIEATLSRVGGTAATDITVEQALVRTADGTGVASTIEFPSVPTNVEHTISVRIYSGSNPGVTLHSGAKTVSPITRAERNEPVAVRLNEAVVSEAVAANGIPYPLDLDGSPFGLYRLDVAAGNPHILTLDGELATSEARILSGAFRSTGISFVETGNELIAELPQSAVPYYLALYRPTDDPAGPLATSATLTPVVFSSSTITITNPSLPTFTIDNGGVTLDRSVPGDGWNLEVIPEDGIALTAFEWFVNNESRATTAVFLLAADDPATVLGTNTLTLFVQIDGLWYSDSFQFQVVEN